MDCVQEGEKSRSPSLNRTESQNVNMTPVKSLFGRNQLSIPPVDYRKTEIPIGGSLPNAQDLEISARNPHGQIDATQQPKIISFNKNIYSNVQDEAVITNVLPTHMRNLPKAETLRLKESMSNHCGMNYLEPLISSKKPAQKYLYVNEVTRHVPVAHDYQI